MTGEIEEPTYSENQLLCVITLADTVHVFYNRLAKRMEKQYRTDYTELKKEYARLKSRNTEIDGIIGSLYADKSKGILSEKRFVKLMGDLEAEQAENEARMQELSKLLIDKRYCMW